MKRRRDVFQAIADPTRRAILMLLASQSLTAGAIASNFEAARPTISNHIKILNECELLIKDQNGREIYYTVDPVQLNSVSLWLEQFKSIWEDRFSNLDSILSNLKK